MNCALCLLVRRVIGIALLAVVFSLTARYAWMVLAATIVLGFVPTWRAIMWRQAVRITKAMDRLLAAQLFVSGDETVTSECSQRRDKVLFCSWVCRVADFFDPGHCDRGSGGPAQTA